MIRATLERARGVLHVGRRFWPDLRPHALPIGLIGLATLLTVVLEIVRPWPIKWIVDSALGKHAKGGLDPLWVIGWGAAAAFGIVALDCLMDYFAAITSSRVGRGFARSLRERLFAHLGRLSPVFHAAHPTGDLLVRVLGDVPLVRGMLVESVVGLVTRTCLVTGTLIAMACVDPLLTLVVLAVVPLFLLLLVGLSSQLTTAARKQRRKEGALADYLHESIAATPTIQSLGRSAHVASVFAEGNRRATRAELKASRISARLSVSVDALFGTCAAVALGFGALRVKEGQLSVGELLVFLAYVRSILKPMRATSKHSERVAKGLASAERILSVLDEPIAVQSGAAGVRPAAAPRELRFEDVHFSYGPAIDALRGFQAGFRRGELVGVFGRSGSGKSTVAALALRLYDPQRGDVLLDDVPLREHDLQALRDGIAPAMQDSVLFGVSIRENLLLGRPDAPEDELWRALREAGAESFVAALPEGLDAELGSGGVGLSGGERRRLCLARALLRDARVLVIDEPFAGLDRAASGHVLETLRQRAEHAIVIVIAHEVERLDLFDRIVFVREGRVEDTGPHADLLVRSAAYRRATRLGAENVA